MALDKEERILELTQSGSKALKSLDEFGRHTFLAPQMGGEMDGETVGRLRRMKYDESELVKAIDTTVSELIKAKPTEQPDVVLLDEYNSVLDRLARANSIIEQVRAELATEKGLSKSLEARVDGLLSLSLIHI